jgi:flagellin-like protein
MSMKEICSHSLFSTITHFIRSVIFFKSFGTYFANKKAISPVIATALLLVVAVVAVVGFQQWYVNYSSDLFSSAETSGSISNVRIDSLISGNTLYLYNGNQNAVEILSIKSNGNNCYVSGDYTAGMNEIYLSNCTNIGINDIVITSSNGIMSKKIYSEYSYSNPCPTGYILVPGSTYFNIKNFCVMKYEAKAYNTASQAVDADGCNEAECTTTNWGISEHTPKSVAEGSPWRRINFTNARAECDSLGNGYHMITNREWMTIARNIEQVASNWNSGVVGTGILKRGNVGITDGGSYNGADPANRVDDIDTKALLNMSNSETIWDLSGNVWEWVDAGEDGSTTDGDGCTGGVTAWYSFYDNDGYAECTFISPYFKTASNDIKYEVGPLGNYNANNGMGRIYSSSTQMVSAFLRGGNWNSGTSVGAFALYLLSALSGTSMSIGFRCTYTP